MGPFAGRRREMSELHAALAGGSRLVLVAGDAGIGKTRFVTEGLRGTRSVWGACLPLAEKLPFLPVTEALDALSRVENGALLAGALAAIPAYAQAEAVRLLPRLQPPDAGPRGGGQRERMFSGLTELLAEAARPGRLAVAIEDVHWADGATLDFLTFLARTGRADAITVVATVRSDETPAEPAVTRWLAYARGSGHAREIRLGPLTRDEMAEQVNGLTGGQLPPAAWAELYARGEGNPFFTEQLVAEAMAGGGLGGLPARLAELLTARVSDCGPQAWPLLAAVSVAGRPLTEDQLAGVTGLDAGALRAGLRELASRSLAETAPGGRHLAGDAEGAGALAEQACRRFAGHPIRRSRRWSASAPHGSAVSATCSSAGGRRPLGLPLITEALALFDQAPPSADHAEALFYYGHYLFTGQGRREEAVTAIRRGLAIAEAAGATALIPRMQPLLAYHHFLAPR